MDEPIEVKTTDKAGHRRQLAWYLHAMADRVAALEVLEQLEQATDEDFVSHADEWVATLRRVLGGIPLDWPGYWTQVPVLPTREMAAVMPYSLNGGMIQASSEQERLHFLRLAIAAAPKPGEPLAGGGDDAGAAAAYRALYDAARAVLGASGGLPVGPLHESLRHLEGVLVAGEPFRRL